jgi:hypothetical protein
MALPKREDWFKHQFRAREDEKLIKLKIKYKSSAPIGVYWQLVELIYENDGSIKYDVEVIAYKLGDSVELVQDVIDDCFNLTDEGEITHNTILSQLQFREEKYKEKSKKGTENANKRWEMERQKLLDQYQTNTTPMGDPYQTHTNSILDQMGVDARVESTENRDESREIRDKSYKEGVVANTLEAIAERPLYKKLKLFQIEQMYPDLSTPEHYKLLNNQ